MPREFAKYYSTKNMKLHRLIFRDTKVFFPYYTGTMTQALGPLRDRKVKVLGSGVYGEVSSVTNPLWKPSKSNYMSRRIVYKKFSKETYKMVQTDAILTEYCIGSIFSEIRAEIPNFACHYALVTETRLPVGNLKDFDPSKIHILSEFVEGVSWNTGFEKIHPPRERIFVYQQLLIALAFVNDRYKYNHNDLHGDNIILMPVKGRPITYTVTIRGISYTVTTSLIPVIIDQGFARITYEGLELGPFWMNRDMVAHNYNVLWEPWKRETAEVLLTLEEGDVLVPDDIYNALTEGPITPLRAIEIIQGMYPHKGVKIAIDYIYRPITPNPIYECKMKKVKLPEACIRELLSQQPGLVQGAGPAVIAGNRFAIQEFTALAMQEKVLEPAGKRILDNFHANLKLDTDAFVDVVDSTRTGELFAFMDILVRNYTKWARGDPIQLMACNEIYDAHLDGFEELVGVYHALKMLSRQVRGLLDLSIFVDLWESNNYKVILDFYDIVKSRVHEKRALRMRTILQYDESQVGRDQEREERDLSRVVAERVRPFENTP